MGNYYDVETVTVDDYAFYRALDVFEKHRQRDVFIAPSDQIAFALKHLLIASESRRRRTRASLERALRNRIVGFDDSQVAKRAGIPSFCQQREQLGTMVIERLCAFFNSETRHEWPEFEEILIEVFLEQRHG